MGKSTINGQFSIAQIPGLVLTSGITGLRNICRGFWALQTVARKTKRSPQGAAVSAGKNMENVENM